MLEVRDIDCFYGNVQVLRELSFSVEAGEALCLLGRNGAGKTTALKAIMGLIRPKSGKVLLDGVDLTALPAQHVPRQGIAYVPQGRRLFAELTVGENLEIGLMARKRGAETLERVLDMFPVLRERKRQRSGTLSGGEQQMLAMARALCLEPKVLLLDEPTEGLMPSMIAKIRDSAAELRDQGVAVVLVEQRVDAVLPIADRVAFIENGRTRDTVPVQALRDDPSLVHRYIGVGH
jgi:branched-chain amino acid transport system ATP-binding protein